MKVFKENSKPISPLSTDSIFYIGTYTDESVLAHDPKGKPSTAGIQSFRLDARSGKLTPLASCDVGPNPAFLLKHPTKPILWASTECIETDGDIITLAMKHSGELQPIATQTSGGKSTCYLTLAEDGSHMLAVSYWDAKLAVLPLNHDGTVGAASSVTMQPGAEYVATNKPDRKEHWAYRQRWPHTHCMVTEPWTRRLHFVCDLGKDSILIYKHCAGQIALTATVRLRPQHGPRHIVFHPTKRVAYLVNELISSVTVFTVGDLSELGTGGEPVVCDSTAEGTTLLREAMVINTLPEGVENSGTWHEGGVWKADSHCSEIRIDPEGRFVYVGNRGHDSITVFKVDPSSGMLTQTAVQPSGGEFPRNFNFSVCGRFLVVGNQRSNLLTVFERAADTGMLTKTSEAHVPSPNYVYACPLLE